MAGINKVILVGHLGRDPEVRYTPNGKAVASFSIATSKNWTDKQGQRQERTEWHRIVVWDKLAELCGEYLAKGRQVYIEGELQTRDWTDRENNKRQTTEIRALEVQFLGGRDGAGGGGGGGAPRRANAMTAGDVAGGHGGGHGGGHSGGNNDMGLDYGPPPSDDDVPF